MKASVRCNALDMVGLSKAEAHGKRLDHTSRARMIRELKPLVAGGLDLRAAYEKHMEGVRMNAGAKKPVLHFIVRFPPDLLDGPEVGKFLGDQKARQTEMVRQAIRFINQTHGGKAAFAARLDRDELGETIVDVFAVPKYEKRTKRLKADEPGQIWASATKFGKELALKHEDEIRRRHPNSKSSALTGPRMVGIALQSEFAKFFETINGIKLEPKVEKLKKAPDRIERELWADLEERRAELNEINAQIERERGHLVHLANKLQSAISKALEFARRSGTPTIDRIEAARMSKDAAELLLEVQKTLPPTEDPLYYPGPGF